MSYSLSNLASDFSTGPYPSLASKTANGLNLLDRAITDYEENKDLFRVLNAFTPNYHKVSVKDVLLAVNQISTEEFKISHS